MQNYEYSYNPYSFHQKVDSSFNQKLEEQKKFGYSLESNFGNVFKSYTKIYGNIVSHGPVTSGLYAGLGSKWRFMLPKHNGYLAQLFIRTRIKTDLDISNILYSGSLVFNDVTLRNGDTFIIDKTDPHYEYARSEARANNSHAADKMEALLTYTPVGPNEYEAISIPQFHCFETPSLMLNTNYLDQMHLDLSVADTMFQMGIPSTDIPVQFEISSIEVVGVYYVLHRGIQSIDQPIYQLSVQHECEKTHAVDGISGKITIPIECDKGPFELVLQIVNDRFKFLQINRFVIYENNRPIIDVDRKLNFIQSDNTYNSSVGSMIYNFGFSNSRVEKSGMLPLNNDKTYSLEVFYDPKELTDMTDYDLHVLWSYFEPRVIMPNGTITNFNVL